jgi:galactokinase
LWRPSERFKEKITLSLDKLSGPPQRHWSDFIRGTAATLQAEGHKLSGINLLIEGEVPLGAGLSSSASLEMATALAMTSISGVNVDRLELVKLCQKTEHQYCRHALRNHGPVCFRFRKGGTQSDA